MDPSRNNSRCHSRNLETLLSSDLFRWPALGQTARRYPHEGFSSFVRLREVDSLWTLDPRLASPLTSHRRFPSATRSTPERCLVFLPNARQAKPDRPYWMFSL